MNRLRDLFDHLTLYLPILLMGLLAMATYWLVRSAPAIEAPRAAAPVQHLPDYFMREFSVKTFVANGQLKSEITGSEAHHYPDTDTIEIDRVHIRSFNEAGELTTASALRAISNSNASDVQLIGQALVERQASRDASGKEQAALTFRGEFLHAFMDTERVTSDKPVELTRGKDRFTANSMDYDNKDRVMLLTGRVRGHLAPARTP
ncbi:MAG: LPS export ABC transporter periplasmic protein LptC [Comamonadaceae bacterium CG_4_9_14_3_um_filter_60_33]|nr:MAG: LPS export ABC transporter periplasmic protein LptC [Comamonadaceae bacterium CG2_30_59_20]PIY27924.1 MAG: LPS export ABC transporter periplasmic protein LptC [Comamonadaceae bacterium CG_4_10_14_3_um_filter_60_42]PJB42782.1 MAG: LPS export ABC transporter periplasmic protein LptC [Comamonadaceae bacterium CG_4_9_14_3_um_filter_60_33]